MVRETRHLWVGNLPDNIREDRIREHFKRYGRVQNVKLLGRTENATIGVGSSGNSGICATVAFMDIKSASKAHNAEHVLDERTLTTEYYEPAAIPSAAGAPSAGSSPAGSGYSGSSSSVNSTPAPASVSRYHMTGGEDGTGNTCPLAASAAAPATWRGTNDSATEYCRRGNTPAAYGRTTPHHRWYASGERAAGATGGESTPSTPGGGTESGRRRRHSGSGSSRSESSSPEPSDTSRASTPAAQPPLPHHANHRAPHPNQHQWAAASSGRTLAICVRNLPTRSTDSSLKDGLYHEYKKHGKVMWVKVVGQNADRYAVVRFKKPSDVEKALEVSQDKLFFGCKISVAPHQSCDEDADSAKPYETDIDEYHPKATRTLFIGNLEKDVTQQQLRDKFKHFGRIIEIDIKKGSGGGAGYAFCQYASISSVVEAIRAMDGEYVGGSRVKLGFGKPVATTCVWVDGLTEHTEKQEAFYEQLEKHGGSAALAGSERLVGDVSTRYLPSTRHESLRYENCGSRSRASSYGRGSSRTPRYTAVEHYDPTDYAADRRYRVYDEVGSSPQTEEAPYEDRLQSVVVSPHRARRHRRDSSPEDRKHSKDRHPRVGGRRSRSGSRGVVGERHASRRRHRRRRDGSGSRAGTPLRDEPDAPPVEPRRPPRERPPLPMSLPLPKFAVQLLRTVPPTPRPQPAPAPDSPPRPPSASSSSTGSAPHSPSLEERIRSLDEKYEKWSGSRVSADAPDRTRLRHRLLDVDINEVKPSEVVRSLLAKRSVFDEDSERLEGAVRPPSPNGSPRSRSSCSARSLRLPYSMHSAHSPHLSLSHLGLASHSPHLTLNSTEPEGDASDRPADPRLNRPERPIKFEKLGKFNESDYRLESRIRPRTPSTDRSQLDSSDRLSPGTIRDQLDETKEEGTRKHRDSTGNCETERKNSLDYNTKECQESIESVDFDLKNKMCSDFDTSHSTKTKIYEKIVSSSLTVKIEGSQEDKQSEEPLILQSEEKSARDVMDMLIKSVEQRHDSLKLESTEKPNFLVGDKTTLLPGYHEKLENKVTVDIEREQKIICQAIDNSDKNKETLITNHVSKDINDTDLHQKHLNSMNTVKVSKESYEFTPDLVKSCDKNGKERYNHNILDVLHNTKLEKENIHFDKTFEKEKYVNNIKQHISVDKKGDNEKHDERLKNEREKLRKERCEKDRHENEKSKGRTDKVSDKMEKKSKEELFLDRYTDKEEKIKCEKDDKPQKEKKDSRDIEKSSKHFDEKLSRYDHHRKEKNDKDKRKESVDETKLKKEDKHRHERCKKDSEVKKENKKDSECIKIRKSSRDETPREIARKDSTDSSTSRASHESTRLKELENSDIKEDSKYKLKQTDLFGKLDNDKDFLSKCVDIKSENAIKIKTETREDKDMLEFQPKIKSENVDANFKIKTDFTEKQRHYSLDSPNVDSKRKERLNSCSSLPSNIGHKRRISSQDSLDSITDDNKKSRNDNKVFERRDSKDSKSNDRHKTTKFNKGHFAKLIESKTKDDKKNQVKPPDEAFVDYKDSDAKEKPTDRNKPVKINSKEEGEKSNDIQQEGLHKDLDFLATLELRSSEEDERQKALRKEMKEKKRIQQLQQIQELQMQQDAMQQAELMIKNKDDKKQKCDEKKKEAAREKRMSTDRKSREEKCESSKRKNRKHVQTSDSSDSDEPKKHSIFDIIDDGPTYISMYDKVKARSCKNMQKQEEEKRQEKIKAKFSQFKQCRAKKEEKKRSSWDEDSDSDQDKKKAPKSSMLNSSDEESILMSKRHDKSHLTNSDCDTKKSDEYFDVTSNEENLPNKLSRKNSRTRIMSDTSDDDTPKRSVSKSPIFLNEIKKEPLSDSDSMHMLKSDEIKEGSERKMKKNTLLNLFGKSDGDESKTNCSTDMDREYKAAFTKSLSNEFSSENESITSSRNITENRKKHKKKQKRHKFLYSDDESKGENRDLILQDGDNKHKTIDKQRRHSNKKEKRKDRTRESIDTDDARDEKVKFRKDKKSPNNNCFDFVSETSSSNIKKDGKMEDIFGPLSDESDKDTRVHSKHKSDFPSREYDSNYGKNDIIESKLNNGEGKLKEKDENRRRKERKRKERRLFKEDDNSLDVDAVSKAIEARLFAESITDEENRLRIELPDGSDKSDQRETSFIDSNLISEFVKQEKMKKECKEKKKRKKK
ncbi:hypothetical protein O3G_MSEX002822 [Manduca sexta]|uniref:RRM domain-containing protein n=1 Tax=Manduca sexta TaxID=7130 RepID=A0A922CDU9_MANSE|nr:hypothetical protein O3G_MSEX002822 [Manduca sexta]